VKLKRDVGEGERLHWADVEIDTNDRTYRFRREMERQFPKPETF
jgi:hypothetical protein